MIRVLPHGVKSMGCISTGAQKYSVYENHRWSLINPHPPGGNVGMCTFIILHFVEKAWECYNIYCEPTTLRKKALHINWKPLCGGRVTPPLHLCPVTDAHHLGFLFPIGVFILLYTFTTYGLKWYIALFHIVLSLKQMIYCTPCGTISFFHSILYL